MQNNIVKFDRRQFVKRGAVTVIGLRLAQGTLFVAVIEGVGGCNVFSDILNWVPVGESSLNALLAVLSANGYAISPQAQLIVNAVEAGFGQLLAAVKEYQSTTPPPVGAVQKVSAAIKAVVDQFQQFLASLNVPGTLFNVIAGLAQVILSTIAAFQNRLPATATAKLVGDTYHVGTVSLAVVPKERRRGSYKRDFNSVLTTGTHYGVLCPQSAYLKMSLADHLHLT